MDCYTLGQTLAHRTIAIIRVVRHPVARTIGRATQAVHRASRPVKAAAPHLAIPRIACRPPPGFLASMVKAAGIAAIGAPLLGGPASPVVAPGIAAAFGDGISGIAAAAPAASASAGGPLSTAATPVSGAAATPPAQPAVVAAVPADAGSPAGSIPMFGPVTLPVMPSVMPVASPTIPADALQPVGLDTAALIPTAVPSAGGTAPATPATPGPAAVTQPIPVQEPSTAAILAAALLGLAAGRRGIRGSAGRGAASPPRS